MKARKFWITLCSVTLVVAGLTGWLIYTELGRIEDCKKQVATLRNNIDKARKLVEGTSALEDEVIVLREVSDLIKQILPDEDDVNNFIKTLNGFASDVGMNTTAFRKKTEARSPRDKSDFEKVAYTFSLEGDIFQFLGMLNALETHKRFIAVPGFKLTAATRKSVEEDGVARHRIQLDVETYKYAPNTTSTPSKIEGYERKRDLLAGEINRRRSALVLASYTYRGPRGRRDPWIDPRVPNIEGPEVWTVQEQQKLVEDLVVRVAEGREKWQEVEQAPDVLRRLVARQDLGEIVAYLEEELRVIASEGKMTYVPAVKRLEKEVNDPVKELRGLLEQTVDILGPPREVLIGVRDGMRSHLSRGEYDLAKQAFETVASELDLVRGDSVREELAIELRALAEDAAILRDFDKIKLDIGGFALGEGLRPVILINGRSMTVGDMINPELEVQSIRQSEIDFIFRGVILTRHF